MVYLGRHTRTRELVAVKVMQLGQKELDSDKVFEMEVRANCAAREHPYVLPLLGHYHIEDAAYLVFKHCAGGEVFQQVEPSKGVRCNLAPRFFAQLTDAVAHLHARGVCHLDIKTENMFLDDSGNMLLGDFGLSHMAADGLALGTRGSLAYAAPENLCSQELIAYGRAGEAGYDGCKADIWSCGIVLYVLLYGQTPWDAARDDVANYRVYKAADGAPNVKPWNRMPTALRSLFRRALCVLAGRRWDAARLRNYVHLDLGWRPRGRAAGRARVCI